MGNVKSKISNRLLAAFLSLLMVFSTIPCSTIVYAATTEHPDSVTITVIDEDGQAIKGASVAFTVDSVSNGNACISNTKTTDDYGVVEIMASSDFIADDFAVSAVVTATGYEEKTLPVTKITTDYDNFEVALVSTSIKDVTIEGKTLTYNGSAQELVSVTEVPGDTVIYEVVGQAATTEKPKATNADTYEIKVTVKRSGKDDLVRTVTTIIRPADIEGISIEGKSIAYNENAHEIVTLYGSFEQGDVVTWTVNTVDTVSTNIPTATAVGQYTIVLTVDRGSNYNKLITAPVTTNLIEGNLDLAGLVVKGLEGVYTVENGIPVAQPAVTVENKGNYDLKYQLDDGDMTVDDSAWLDEIPAVTDAGSYIIWVKAVKDSYNDKDVSVTPAESAVAPYNVYIAKAEQSFSFDGYTGTGITEQISGAVPYNKTYDFSAADTAALAGGTISYDIELDEDGIASINERTGLLTVDYPGTITVIATLSGNDNYKDCVIKYTLDISGVVSVQGQYISFANNQVDYVIGTSDTVANQAAAKNNSRIKGSISYALDRTPGVRINSNNGEVTVTDYNALAEAIRATSAGSLELTVTATKAKFGKYGVDTASYIISIAFEATPANPYTLSAVDGTNGWYISNVDVIPEKGYVIAKAAADSFADSVTFSDQGTATRYVYLKNTTTGGITDQIAVDVKIDTVAPDTSKMNIEIQELNIIEKMGMKFGFYNPTVNIRFIVDDELASDESGLDYIVWFYTKGGDATSSILADKSDYIPVTEQDGKYVATLSVSATDAEQFRGHIAFKACDVAGNKSNEVKENNIVIVVDTINPVMSADFRLVDANGKYNPVTKNGIEQHYYNGDVEFTFTVKEANFFSEDVDINVTKDGAAHSVSVSWSTDSNNDEVHYGKFTLSGDGDYAVSMSCKDQTNNVMVDRTGSEVALYTSEVITIDTIKPVVKIDYIHNGDVQKTIFTVNEHNFRASDIVISGTMKDINGNNIAYTPALLTELLQTATWTPSGQDTYTFEYDGYADGIFNLAMDYKDISGWDAEAFVAEQFIIDHSAPTNVSIEIVTTPLDTILGAITFGFYNPDVTVRFTAYDDASGVKSFTWNYTKENGASDINRPTDLQLTTVNAVQDTTDKSKYTAAITLPDTEEKQLRGFLAAYATDVYENDSDKITDDGSIIVVDTIAPEVKVEYSEASSTVGTKAYYNGNIDVTVSVVEANFYSDDVIVKVSKNGGTATSVVPVWTDVTVDQHVGRFTLTEDGHYIFTVEYKDKSENFDAQKSAYSSHELIIDTIKPVIKVDYQNSSVVNTLTDSENHNRKYFDDTQKAVVTITEHNFNADEVDFTIIAKDVSGQSLDPSALNIKSAWSVDSTGDIHTITITYPGDANYTFDVAYTDPATNKADDYATDYFTVDKTEPENLTVEYSTSVLDTMLESFTFGFYNAKMTVTLTVEDSTSEINSFLYSYLNASGVSSVNSELVNQVIDAKSIKYSGDRKTATVTFEIPKVVLSNDNQFNGTVEFTAADRSGNESKTHKETKRIVVDNIAPTAQVSYNEATNTVDDISYYNGNINAAVTINEANFYANDVQVMVSKDGKAATAVTPNWTDNNADVHVGTFTLTEDGDYIVTINYTDKSLNRMTTYTSKQMTIDTNIEVPTYTINGIAKTELGGAYKGEAIIGFNFEDQNFDTRTIKLTRTRFDKVEDVTDIYINVSDNDKGGSGSFTIPSEVSNDGIYVLSIGLTDKAKHTAESEVKFTINRFGSVYEYSDKLVSLIKDGGQYIKFVDDDLVITEYNADRILEGSLKILITRDGENVDVDFTSNPENINAQVGIGESGWFQYVYTIKASNFEKDGVYKISLTSSYASDDSDKNESASVPENSIDEQGKEILDTMSFTVDSVAPEIRNIVNLDKKIADVDKIVDGKLNVKYTVVDVGGLKSIEIILNGKTIQTLTEEDIADNAYNFSGSFDIAEQDSTTAQKVRIVVTDLAGNVTDTDSEDFLKIHSEDNENSTYLFFNEVTVSRNVFVRWYANRGLFWGSIGGVIAIGGVISFIAAVKRKKKALGK